MLHLRSGYAPVGQLFRLRTLRFDIGVQLMITVARLIEQLAALPPDAIVILAKDAEGTNFSPLPDDDGVTTGWYMPESSWSGDFAVPEPGESDEEYIDDGYVEAVCLWPTN